MSTTPPQKSPQPGARVAQSQFEQPSKGTMFFGSIILSLIINAILALTFKWAKHLTHRKCNSLYTLFIAHVLATSPVTVIASMIFIFSLIWSILTLNAGELSKAGWTFVFILVACFIFGLCYGIHAIFYTMLNKTTKHKYCNKNWVVFVSGIVGHLIWMVASLKIGKD